MIYYIRESIEVGLKTEHMKLEGGGMLEKELEEKS